MTREQLEQFDRFLDENDWDIYYWATQNPPKEGEGEVLESKSGKLGPEVNMEQKVGLGEGPVGEWAQTVGRKKEAYRPPPSRWRDSEILKMVRQHVESKKGPDGTIKGKLGGLGRMPDVRVQE